MALVVLGCFVSVAFLSNWGDTIITGNLCPIPAHSHFGFRATTPESRDPRRIDAAVVDDWCWGAEAEGEAIAGDGRCSTQGAAEH